MLGWPDSRPPPFHGGKDLRRLLCRDCGKELIDREIAMNLKLRGRAIGTFFCMGCLAERVSGTVEELEQMADYFTRNQCELFQRKYVDGK